MKQFSNFATKLDNYLLYLFILILPIFPYSQIILTISILFSIVLIKIIKIILHKKLNFTTGSFDIPILLVAASYLISAFFVSPSKMDAFIYPGTTTIIVSGTLLYFMTNQIESNSKRVLKYILFAGALLYSILVLLISTKVIPWFSPLDNYLFPTLYITALIPIMISVFLTEKEFVYKFLIAVSFAISIFAMIVAIITSNKPKLLSFNISTTIATTVLKQNLFFGVGSSNYSYAFNKYRPYEFNQSDLWSIKFNQGSSFLISNLTETGIIGSMILIALLAIYINFAINKISIRKKIGLKIQDLLPLLTGFIFFVELIIFGCPPIIFFVLFIILGIVSESKRYDHAMPTRIISLIIALPLFSIVLLAGYKIFNLTKAEYAYNVGLKYLADNKAKLSYDKFKESINLNSKVDRYHKAMSSVNFGIATAISQKQNINDSEKEQITGFIKNSIDEAKAAVAINNKSSENWEFLGRTYHLIIPFTKGADQFAIESYKEAIALDPINPNLRIKLGEVYMIQKKYDLAIETFNLAILAKDNHPNAHYNLAIAYKENKEIEKAKTELKKTLSLIKEDNIKDYDMAKKELDSLNTIDQN